jgi:hypothetical protein
MPDPEQCVASRFLSLSKDGCAALRLDLSNPSATHLPGAMQIFLELVT